MVFCPQHELSFCKQSFFNCPAISSVILCLYLWLRSWASSLFSSSSSKSSHLSAVKTSFSFSFLLACITLKEGIIASAGLITFVPYTKEKGENPMADLGEVLKPKVHLADALPNLCCTPGSSCWWSWWGFCLLLLLAYSLAGNKVMTGDASLDRTPTSSLLLCWQMYHCHLWFCEAHQIWQLYFL